MRVDSHQHFWVRSRGDYGWLRDDVPELAPLLRDFLPADLRPLMVASGIDTTVLVQAADSVAETEFLLDLAARHDFVGGVVGWVDLAREDAAATLERLVSHAKLKSVRPMLQDLPDIDWIARAPRPEAVRALLRLGLRFDALVKPQHLPALLAFAREWPELPLVIDHAAKPRLVDGWSADWAANWRRGLAALAALPQVTCKLSGLATELPAPACATPGALVESLKPVWDTLLETFGPARLMWGSDWPVLTAAASHGHWVAASEMLVAPLSPSEQAMVWAGTARRFYGLGG